MLTRTLALGLVVSLAAMIVASPAEVKYTPSYVEDKSVYEPYPTEKSKHVDYKADGGKKYEDLKKLCFKLKKDKEDGKDGGKKVYARDFGAEHKELESKCKEIFKKMDGKKDGKKMDGKKHKDGKKDGKHEKDGGKMEEPYKSVDKKEEPYEPVEYKDGKDKSYTKRDEIKGEDTKHKVDYSSYFKSPKSEKSWKLGGSIFLPSAEYKMSCSIGVNPIYD